MELESIVKTTAIYLGLNQVINYLETGDSNNLEQVKQDVDALTKCLNLVIEEVSTQYCPFVLEENVMAVNKKIPYSAFTKRVLEIISVKNRNQKKVSFKVYPEYLKVAEDDVIVEYSYLIENLKITDAITFTNPKITERILAYGVASEYSLVKSNFDESLVWEERFKEGLMLALSPKNLRIPLRRWC